MPIKRTTQIVAVLFALALCPFSWGQKYKPFAPHRDAEQDLLVAEKQAADQHRKILLDFGANWCPGCVALDMFMHQDPQLKTILERDYIVVHADIGGWISNKKTRALRKLYPKSTTIPHILILAPDGTLLHDGSDDLRTLNPQRTNFDSDAIAAVLEKWAHAAK
jgi:thioredoxin 1